MSETKTAVEQAKAAGHVLTDKTELGYTRRVCRECGSDWPCAEFAQAAHRDADPDDPSHLVR